jgi:hypothetical protein
MEVLKELALPRFKGGKKAQASRDRLWGMKRYLRVDGERDPRSSEPSMVGRNSRNDFNHRRGMWG